MYIFLRRHYPHQVKGSKSDDFLSARKHKLPCIYLHYITSKTVMQEGPSRFSQAAFRKMLSEFQNFHTHSLKHPPCKQSLSGVCRKPQGFLHRLRAFSELVEVAGVEPASESTLTGLSPGADDYCGNLLPCSPPQRQTVTRVRSGESHGAWAGQLFPASRTPHQRRLPRPVASPVQTAAIN